MRHFDNLLLAIMPAKWMVCGAVHDGGRFLPPVEDMVANSCWVAVSCCSASDPNSSVCKKLPTPDLQPELEEPEKDSVSPDKNTSVGATNNTGTQAAVKAKRSLAVRL